MQITARVTANAAVKEVKSGSKVVNFSVAVNDRFRTKDGEQKEVTTFFNCSYWLNEGIAPYLTKGTLVELSGRVSASAWANAEGEAKASLNFHADTIKLHGSSRNNRETAPQTQPAAAVTEPIDDLPF